MSIKISVITVVYNGQDTILDTIESVLSQTHDNIEYIIIDGGSTDATLDIVRKYFDKISVVVSEPDNGIYDAMNKGVMLATGEVVAILNADDYYVNQHVLENISNCYPFDILATSTVVESNEGSAVFHPSHFDVGKLYLRMPFMHPSSFVSRKVYERIGLYSQKYSLAADCDFLMRCSKRGVELSILDMESVYMRSGGASDRGYLKGRKEYYSAYCNNFGRRFWASVGFLISIAEYYAYKVYRRLF
jgi:glycosyltransferase involved in cell wall biosynthesis